MLKNFTSFVFLLFFTGVVFGQTNPTAQSLPYSQDFSALAWTSTSYPSGWQGWKVGNSAGSSYSTAAPSADYSLTASATATSNAVGVYNYNGKTGFLSSGSGDASIVLAVNTTGLSTISVGYDIMTIRNPYDGSSNTRLNSVTLQYRVGTSGSFTSLTGIDYTNNTTTQTSAVTTPQNQQSFSVTLPSACDNQSTVQLRWVQKDGSGGAGSRPSFAIDNISVGNSSTTYTSISAGDWDDPTIWDVGTVPTAGSTVVINHNVSLTNPLSFTGNITVSNSGSFQLSTTYTNNGNITVSGILQFNSGGSITGTAPTYSSGSTLLYSSGGSFSRNLEWSSTSGVGYPYNVQLSSNTTLDLGANGGTGTARQIANNLTIDNGSTLSMNVSAMTAALTVLGSITTNGTLTLSGSSGGDLKVGGNWIMGGTGALNANSRTVTFNGSSGTQLLTGNTTFYDLTLANTGATTDFGSTTTTIAHNLSHTNGTMTASTSTVIFTGSSGNMSGANAQNYYNLQINGGASITHGAGTGNMHVLNNYVNNGTFTQASSIKTFFDQPSGTASLSGTGTTTFGSIVIGSNSFTALATTLNAGSHSFTVSGSTFTFNSNNSVFNGGTSTVTFSGTCTVGNAVSITGTSATFYNATISAGVDFGNVLSTVNGALQINTGGFLAGNHAVTYGSSSTLVYNTTSSPYGVSYEWTGNSTTAGFGIPQNVTIQNTNTVSMPTSNRGMAGNLNITGGGLILNSTSGDLYVGGNWTRSAGTSFTPNARAVCFNGSAMQTITVSSGESFAYLIINNSSASGVKLSSGTNMSVTTVNGGNGLQLLNSGPLDLNGNTGTLGSNNYGTIQITGGARNVTSSSGTGVFVINGGPIPSPPIVYNSDLASTLTFSSAVRVELNNGFDFSSWTTTINGTLRINSGGFAYNNAPIYGTGSLLQYYTNGVYNRTIEWGTNSGPAYPYNVQLSNNTTLDPGGSSNTGIVLTLAHNLTIDAGSSLYMDYGSDDMTTELYVANDILINGNLSLSDASGGDVRIGGNWTRGASGVFNPKLREAIFNGSSAETISVTGGGTETYDYLRIANSSGVTLSSSPATAVKVNYGLTFVSGNVTTNSNEIYVTSTSSTSIAGEKTDPSVAGFTSSSRVIGNLRRNVAVNTDYYFPVGTASNYELALMRFSNMASITNVLAGFTTGTSGTFTNCTINGTPIVGMLNGGYWTMTPTGTTTGAIYDLTLFETGYTNTVSSPNYIGVIKRSSSSNPWAGTDFGSDGNHVNSTQAFYSGPVAKAVRTSIPTFSDYAIGYSNDIVLPIELTDFTVFPSGSDAVLNWNTSSEYNSDFFSVERSFDGVSFDEIGKVNAAGNSILPSDYSFVDYGVNEFSVDKIYYRLRMVDQDQSFDYSVVRWITIGGNSDESTLVVYPNPFTDHVGLSWNSSNDGNAVVQLVDITGKVISESNLHFTKGNNFFILDQFSTLSQGVYFLRLNAGKTQLTQKLVKQN